jgi:hypothetical protein
MVEKRQQPTTLLHLLCPMQQFLPTEMKLLFVFNRIADIKKHLAERRERKWSGCLAILQRLCCSSKPFTPALYPGFSPCCGGSWAEKKSFALETYTGGMQHNSCTRQLRL